MTKMKINMKKNEENESMWKPKAENENISEERKYQKAKWKYENSKHVWQLLKMMKIKAYEETKNGNQ